MRFESKKQADAEAIRVFADNLRELLLAPPLGQKSVLALDPGFRTGCKVVCLDRQGKLLHHDVIFPTAASEAQARQAGDTVRALVQRFGIEAIAIGNGTAEPRDRSVRARPRPARHRSPSSWSTRAGASIYSACDVAREEFPDQDLTVRGAVAHRPPAAWTRWPSWSRSTPSRSASASTSTTWTRRRSSAASTTWS